MGKAKTKVKTRDKRRAREIEDREDGTVIPFKRKFEVERQAPPIVAMNARQAEYIAYLRTHPQVFVLGPAGTGKTWIAASHAADLYRGGLITKIILTRPNVPCGRSLGFFPGTIESKFAPWTVPVTDAMRDRLGKADNVQNLSHFSKRAVSFTLKEERGHEGRERRQTDGASHQDR
jgi:phosphate starvation-inducible PhoH-like protein